MKKIPFTLLMLVLLLTLVGCGHKHEYTDEVVAPTCTECVTYTVNYTVNGETKSVILYSIVSGKLK